MAMNHFKNQDAQFIFYFGGRLSMIRVRILASCWCVRGALISGPSFGSMNHPTVLCLA